MKSSEFKRILDELSEGRAAGLTITACGEKLERVFMPTDRLILLGGGHVSLAVCELAVMLDFAVTVVDDRPEFANHTRFPQAEKVICKDFTSAISELNVAAGDYVCVLTRGHRWDEECVRAILDGGAMPAYMGMISSRRRADGLRDILKDSGYPEEKIAAIHAPIGLSIGVVTPAEIALSICAEMVAHRRREPMRFGSNVMRQFNADRDMLRFLAEADEPRAMLLVLDSSGSTPVKSGAVMAVNALGKGCGTIGGGCSEAAAVNAARRVIGTGGAKILEFDMSNEVAAENGLVCGGFMRVLIEDITK